MKKMEHKDIVEIEEKMNQLDHQRREYKNQMHNLDEKSNKIINKLNRGISTNNSQLLDFENKLSDFESREGEFKDQLKKSVTDYISSEDFSISLQNSIKLEIRHILTEKAKKDFIKTIKFDEIIKRRIKNIINSKTAEQLQELKNKWIVKLLK